MKVSYIECDICKKKIKGEQYRYSSLYSVPDPLSPYGNEVACETRIDICKSCMDGFKKWLSDEVTKGAKDGPST